jgi:methionyl-tRNA synthetase
LSFEAQYKYIATHKEQYKRYARNHYQRVKADPERAALRDAKRSVWYEANKSLLLEKQKLKKRRRKLEAIEYLGGKCNNCGGMVHPAAFEFHHRDPAGKERDPSKMLNLSWERAKAELAKCDLVCANCHREIHYTWE